MALRSNHSGAEIPSDPGEHAAVFFVAGVLDGTQKFLVARWPTRLTLHG